MNLNLLNPDTYPEPSASISFTISFSALGFTRNPIIDKIVPIVSTCIAPSTQNPSKHFFSTEEIIVTNRWLSILPFPELFLGLCLNNYTIKKTYHLLAPALNRFRPKDEKVNTLNIDRLNDTQPATLFHTKLSVR